MLPFSAAAFSDVGFNPNAFVNVLGSRINVNIGNSTISGDANFSVTGNRVNISTGSVTIIGKAREVLSGNGLELGIGNAQASIPKDVPVTGNGFELVKEQSLQKLEPYQQSHQMDLISVQVMLQLLVNVIYLLEIVLNITIGDVTAKANATAIVSGKRFNIGNKRCNRIS